MSDDDSLEGRIAIIGMSGRFPGAATIGEFWENLCGEVDSVTHFTDDQLDDWFDREVRAAPNYVKARPILTGVDGFDAGFFGMQAKEAALTDPQHRVFLECSWEALEDAGYDPAAYQGAIGVFAGCSMNTYFLSNICRDRRAIEKFASSFQVGEYPTLLGAGREFLATRVSYKLDLRGPSMTVQSACSTSLVAIIQACQNLLLYQADMALAGGVSITFPQNRGYLHQEGGMVSADGRCRPFDAAASGTIFGSGAGVVLLKRLDEALAEGDHIYAIIRGWGVNNDGAAKVGFTAPSADGQAAAIEMALAQAGIDARSVGYIECHGTATPLGDPIEIAGLTKAFRKTTADRQFCAIGSVKGNIGHLDAAAGVAGLIKAALALQHRAIPPTLHFERPNPQIDFAATPFTVNVRLADWPEGAEPRRAGVSSLGVGGTNAHVILEEMPAAGGARGLGAKPPHLLPLSARSEAALGSMRLRLAEHLRAQPEQSLADVARTLQRGRRHFSHRCVVVCRDRADAAAALSATDPSDGHLGAIKADGTPLIFMFPGQGAQYPHMAGGLYRRYPEFRRHLDRCAAILAPLGIDLLNALYGPASDDKAERLSMTGTAQPAIFAIEYALAQLWRSWGVEPQGLMGHSVGEFVAACLAGVFSLDDALGLVAARGRLMQALPGGGMLAIRLTEGEVAPLLGPGVALAAINGPTHCVVAGPHDELATIERQLEARGAAYRRLHTSHAFHSPMMDPIIAPFAELVAQVAPHEPRLPYISGVTGEWIRPEQATSPEYWARHVREPVRFAAAVKTAIGSTPPILLEVGPSNALSMLALQTARGSGVSAISSLPDASGASADEQRLQEALGQLWINGIDVRWPDLANGMASRVSLPTYPFERSRHWIDPPPREADVASRARDPVITQPAPVDEPELRRNATIMTAISAQGVTASASPDPHSERIRGTIIAILDELSGEQLAAAATATTFLEIGFDSLLLSQVAQRLQSQLNVKIAFRQLLGELSTVDELTAFVARQVPRTPVAPIIPAPAARHHQPSSAAVDETPEGGFEAVMRAQIAALSGLLNSQLETMRRIGLSPAGPAVDAVPPAAAEPSAVDAAAEPEQPSRFQVYKPVQKIGDTGITPDQRRHIDELAARYGAKTAGSKRLTATYRPVLADPRAASGFRSEWKELVYPIVCAGAHGSKIWDVDGNEYVDLVNGYGQTAFGHTPDFVVAAIKEQLDKGFAIGPQAEFAGEVAALFTELTGNERMTFCNTGSEAVMAALRVARAVTGRTKVVLFSGAYHGQFDEVLVKGVKRPDGTRRSVPIAAGIPASAVENVVVLDYATAEALQWVKDNAGDLAAVVVEPVQSRHPGLQPVEFMRQLREITEASGTAFVMDEIVTGFRVHPGGMQAVTGIRADLATYGKVVAGGLPIGILAGKAKFMDALDGGPWNYGDDSVPEVGVTFFAGTFVRHPLTLAAVRAVLTHLKSHDHLLQDGAERRAAALADGLNLLFATYGLAAKAERYSSFLYFSLYGEHPLAGLLFYHLRDRGIHIQDGFPCFLTSAHTDEDIATILAAFGDSLSEMARASIVKLTLAAVPNDNSLPTTAPLTESQIEIWLSAQAGDDASCAFNESVTLRLTGMLDQPALAAALGQVVARHDALRARFSPTGEEMLISDATDFRWSTIDASTAADPSAEQVLSSLVAEDARTPFDLVNGPLIRARLVRLSTTSHALVLTAHHIICDGWSINVIIGEIGQLYAARRDGRAADLATPLSFAAYARAQQSRDPAERAEIESYWLQQFAAPMPPLVQLPTDHPRGAARSSLGATRGRRLDAALYRAVKTAGARQRCTLFVTLLGAFEVLVGRLADAEEVVIGVPTAGQSLIEDDILVGHCVNFLPLRGAWDGETRFADHLGATARLVLDAYEHQDYTLGTLVRKLAPARQANRLPLTEIQFNLERLADRLLLPGLAVDVEPNPKARVNFDLFWNIIESDDGLRIDCDYNTELFEAATIDRWLECYETLLRAIVADAAQPVSRLRYLPPAEFRRLVNDFNDTAADYPRDRCIHQLIEACAAQRPDAVAVTCGRTALSYRELDQRANRLAHHLLAKIGGAGARIGVLVDRSPDLVVALLAVLKAGCAYVPLDPGHPTARLGYILADADVAVLLTDVAPQQLPAVAGAAVVHLRTDREAIAAMPATAPAATASAEQIAYLIYTSGSTGKPKGVVVTHRSVVNLLCGMARKPGLGENDILLAVTTIAFDIAALELFLPLSVGATIALAARDDIADGDRLLARLENSGASVMQATPASWRLLIEAGFHSRRGFKMLCGGEALPRDLANRLLDGGGSLWNMYGPTETTIWSSCAEVQAGDTAITVGYPLANTQFHVLDKNDQPVATGIPGQLHIGGDGVAPGYFRREALTAARFIPDPFGLSARLYRTGDIARRLPDGAIQILGRADQQVKLRGFRIELGEIEAALLTAGGVAAAAAALREDVPGRRQLVGYYVEHPGEPRSPDELRARIAGELPEYMVPAAWVRLSALPVSLNGKLDHAALPVPDPTPLAAAAFSAPETPLEAALAAIWAEVLKVDRIGRQQELFSLGADSIHIFQIAARANRQGMRLSARQLLQNRTVAALAAELERAGEGGKSPPTAIGSGNRRQPVSQVARKRVSAP